MGAKDSKPSIITYEEASKRVSETELKRLREAFKKLAGLNSYITKHAFIRDVLGDGVPTSVAEHIFAACGGTQKGISFVNLVCGLVLLTKGREDEKIKFLFGLYSNESGSYVSRDDMLRLLATTEVAGRTPETVASLFAEGERVSYEQFREWLLRHPGATALSRWLLVEPCSSAASTPHLPQDSDTPTFYQTLAGVTHLEEREIHWLEQRYWALQAASPSGQLDLEAMRPLLSPPVPASAVPGLFLAFDQNHDQHVDFKEMACGISAACRGPLAERHKFCFKVFDADADGRLSSSELHHMAEVLLLVRAEGEASSPIAGEQPDQVEDVLKDVQLQFPSCLQQGLSLEEYLMWAIENPLPERFVRLIFQVCHVVLGLRPTSREEEGEVVLGWLAREERRGLCPGQLWYLIAADWWASWRLYIQASPLVRGGSVPRLARPPMDSGNCLENYSDRTTTNSPRKVASSSALSLLDTPNGIAASPGPSPLPGRKLQTMVMPPGAQLAPRPGAIDNSSLVVTMGPAGSKVASLTAEGGRLRRAVVLTQGRDFQLVPQALWRALLQWYGGAPALPRQVIVPHGSQYAELELYPVTLRILRHQPQPARPTATSGTWSDVVGGYGAAALSSTGYAYVPQLAVPKRYVAYMAAFSRMASVRQVYDFLCFTLRLRAEDARLWHVKDENNMVLLEEEEPTLEELGVQDDDSVLLEVRNKDLTWPEEMGAIQQQQQQQLQQRRQVPTEKGATGLNNLGNTCFMNAALQCVSNTQALTQYFTANMHLYELNRTNPLGMKGHIAKKYGDLIHEIWGGTVKTIAPLKLRWTIGKYAPRFTGFQQHDSQELLAFLLDGLHEDLNRVHDKPYVELKDSGGRPDVEVAQEAWENHVLRNKSIVVDLFHGQLKSKVMCSACGHESVRFDPFNYLSLPLPMESCVHLECIVVRLDGSIPVKYGLRLNMDEKYSAVREHLSLLSGLPACRLYLAEVSGSQIKTGVPDSQRVRSHNSNSLYAYELPARLLAAPEPDLDSEELDEAPDAGSSSLGSLGSSSRSSEAQVFTRIQRMTRPPELPPQNDLGLSPLSATTTQQPSQQQQVQQVQQQAPSLEPEQTGDAQIRRESRGGESSSPDSGHCRGESPGGAGGSNSGDWTRGEMQTGCSAGSSRGRCSPTPSLGAGSLAGSSDSSACSSAASAPLGTGFVVAVHRKMIRQEVYFVAWQRNQPSLFGLPLLVPCGPGTTHQALYEAVWRQVARLVSPLPPSSAPNHAMDCDDSLGYEFPFVLRAVTASGTQCAWCPWFRFCRGCRIQCSDAEFCRMGPDTHLAVDWDPTALHLRYQNSKERVFAEHASVAEARRRQSEPIGLAHCLESFTREEQLGEDEKYSCPSCRNLQLATKKLQIWRLPPILIVHLKRFQSLCGKWVKSQKVVEFPRKHFDPTDYLASVPRETLLRHAELMEMEESGQVTTEQTVRTVPRPRERVESSSLTTTPVEDGALQDFHQHRLEENVDPFRLSYNLYAIVCHSGILGGGHYISYAINPNGKWYCYNDSSCREVSESQIDTSSAYMLFYEREGLCHANYLPNVEPGRPTPDIRDLDDELDSDLRKVCVLA